MSGDDLWEHYIRPRKPDEAVGKAHTSLDDSPFAAALDELAKNPIRENDDFGNNQKLKLQTRTYADNAPEPSSSWAKSPFSLRIRFAGFAL